MRFDIDSFGYELLLCRSFIRLPDVDLGGIVLIRGRPLPRFGTDGEVGCASSLDDCASSLGVSLCRPLDADRASAGLLRLFLGVPLTFLWTGDSSLAFNGTFVVKVLSLKIFDGEHLGVLVLVLVLEPVCSACTVIRMCHGLSLGSSVSRLLLGDFPFAFRASGVVITISCG